MVRRYVKYYNTAQLNQGIKEEMKYGLTREQAAEVARRKLLQSPRYYKRVNELTPTFKQDRRCYRRRQKRAEERANWSPFTQGSLFR